MTVALTEGLLVATGRWWLGLGSTGSRHHPHVGRQGWEDFLMGQDPRDVHGLLAGCQLLAWRPKSPRPWVPSETSRSRVTLSNQPQSRFHLISFIEVATEPPRLKGRHRALRPLMG